MRACTGVILILVTCSFFLQNYPSYCTSTTASVSGIPFSIYCAKSCNTCNSVTLNITPQTTQQVSNQNCVNTNEIFCSIFGILYCTDSSYVNGVFFKDYCAKLCNSCKATQTVISPSASLSSSVPLTTAIPSIGCANKNDAVCTLYGSSYCKSDTYINGELFNVYCPKVCNNSC